MRTPVPSVLVATFLSGLLVVMGAMPAMGYLKPKNVRVFLTGPKVVNCNQTAKISARVVDIKNNKAIRGTRVKWSLAAKQSGRDRLNPRTSTTNRSGVASTRLWFGNKAGQRVVKALSVNATPVHRVSCKPILPKTSVLPPQGYVEQPLELIIDEPVVPPSEVFSTTLPVAHIRMRRLGIDLPVMEGDGFLVPDDAAAHFPDTAWPGEGSNTYIYAHAREGAFLELWQAHTGDLVEMEMVDGSSVDYQVTEIHPLVAWDAAEYLEPTDDEILTLQTCLDYADTAPRFVVIAEPVPST